MRPHVLALALVALLAPAAPASISPPEPFEKKLSDAVKEVLDKDTQIPNAPNEQLLDQTNTIKDIDNQLLKQGAPEPFPVKVVEEAFQPSLKSEKNCQKAEDADIKRVEVDLKHPGEPQRQEHETQNAEHYDDEQGALTSIKQMIKDTQGVFNEGFKDVSHQIEGWIQDNKPEISIKDSIQNLQDTFMENINKLNATIQSYWTQGAADNSEKQVKIQKVQSGLKVLEEKFETGLETLNNGVHNLVVLKSENRDDAASTTAKPSGIPGFPGFVTNFWTQVTQSFGNVTNQFQNIIGQGNNTSQTVPGTQADETSASTSKPSVWQGIQNQIQGIFQNRPGQQQGAQNDEQPAQQSGPFAQVIQNVPLLQNFVNLIQPKPQSPAPAQSSAPSEPAKPNTNEGVNVVPASGTTDSDQQQKKPDQEIQPAQAPGPIQQIIQRNPIAQSIAGAVQKIQHTISNPEKPREEPVEKVAEKAGFYHHGHRPGDGDNNNIIGSGVVKSEPAEAKRPPAPAPEAEISAPAPAEAVQPFVEPAEAVKPAPAPAEAEKPAPASPQAVKQD